MKLGNFAWFFVVLAQFSIIGAAVVKPTVPSEDSFYRTPEDIEDYEPGDIIDYRKSPGQIQSILYPIDIKESWQFLVRSTNNAGNATAIVTTVLVPYGGDPTKVVSYQFAEDAGSENCAPSYAILYGASVSTVITQFEQLFTMSLLSQGWYVVMPDYEGFTAAFTAGPNSGQSTLDSIRAILNTQNTTGIDPDAKVAMWGYSGGTIATGWAAQLQPSYAPELKDVIIGAAMGGYCLNLTATAIATDGTIFAGLIGNAVNGLFSQYPEYADILTDNLDPKKLDDFYAAKDYCLLNAIFNYAFTDFFQGLDPIFATGYAIFEDPRVQEVLSANILALHESDGVPDIPLFVYHAVYDEVIPFTGAKRAFDNYCEWGIESFEISASNSSGHILEWLEGMGAAMKWLDDRFNGTEPIKGCKTTYRETNLDYPGSDLGYYQLVHTALASLAGADIGTTLEVAATTLPEKDFYNLIAEIIGALGTIAVKRDLAWQSFAS